MATSAMARYRQRMMSFGKAKPAKALGHAAGAAAFGAALGYADASVTQNPTTGSGLDASVSSLNIGMDGLGGLAALAAGHHLRSAGLQTAGIVGLASWAQRRVKGWMT
jgi:hypothetical protein